jgi:hypothetical protein
MEIDFETLLNTSITLLGKTGKTDLNSQIEFICVRYLYLNTII